MAWKLGLTALLGFAISALIVFGVQILKAILPARFVAFLKGRNGPVVVWALSLAVATIQLVIQGQLSPVDWGNPLEALGILIAYGSTIAKAADTLYRWFEPRFKKFVELLGGESA